MIKPNSIIKWISVSGLLMAQTTFAGLCADLSSPTRYDLLNVKEFIWNETNVHDLVTPDENRSLDSAQQVQIIETSLSYKIPYQLTLNCQWTRSNTLVLNNFGSDKFSSDDTTQYFKVRDANEEDVENTGNVNIGDGINYWLHQVDSEADTLKDGYDRLDDSTVSLVGTHYPESQDGMFDMWYASIFVTKDDGTATSKLRNSYTIRNDSLKALEAIQGAITEANYPYPTFTSQLQLLKLRFKRSDDQTVGLSQLHSQAPFEIQDNLVMWNEPQARVEIFLMDGRVVQANRNTQITSFEALPNGQYIVRNSNGFTMKFSKF